MRQSNIHIFFILLVAGWVALLAYLTTAITEPTGIVAWLPTSTTICTPSASYHSLEEPMQQPATSKASRTAVSSVLPTVSASTVSGAALPTYSGKAVQSYSGGMGSSMSNGLAVPMATATTHGSGLMVSTTKTSAHATALPTSTQVVPTHNRMLAQGRRQAAGYYGGSVSGQTGTTGNGAIGGPRRLGTVADYWQGLLDGYLASTGQASVSADDEAALRAWLESQEGWNPDTWTEFWNWVPKTSPLPLTGGEIPILLGLLAMYMIRKRYNVTTK